MGVDQKHRLSRLLSWERRLWNREFKRNFHLWEKVRNNVKKLFLTVFLKVRFKRKVAGILMSERPKAWERQGISQLLAGREGTLR